MYYSGFALLTLTFLLLCWIRILGHGEDLFMSLPQPWRAKPFWVEGAGHNNIEAPLRPTGCFVEKLIEFLELHVGARRGGGVRIFFDLARKCSFIFACSLNYLLTHTVSFLITQDISPDTGSRMRPYGVERI